jgi:C4-dicarboxylate-specific signal transduction histidine kinase
MPRRSKYAVTSHALARFLSALMQHFPHVAALAIQPAQNDEALKRSEAFLAKVQRAGAAGSFIWRAAAAEVIASEQIYQIFDLDPALPLTLELMATRIHPEDLSMFHERIEQARRAGGDVDFEPRLRISDGSIRHLHVLAHGITDHDGQLEYIGAVHDVTSRRLSEEALAQARTGFTRIARLTTLGMLAPSIAHEINQPLSGIMNNTNTCLRMLATDPPGLDGARAAALRALRDVERASALIARMRTLVAKREVASEPLDLNDAIQELIALVSSELYRHGVVLRTEFAEELPRVMGDRVQLQQVVLNLLINSAEAMHEIADRPRQLLIETRSDERAQVRVAVRDAGAGFHPRDAERLFEAFYTTKSDGMGIGLYISRAIIESHRGRIWAEPNEDYGATFSFSIPPEPQISRSL